MNCATHVTAPTNKAVVVLAKKYLETYFEEINQPQVTQSYKALLSRVVLVGNMERLEINDSESILLMIHVDARVKRLREAIEHFHTTLSNLNHFLSLCQSYCKVEADFALVSDGRSLDRFVADGLTQFFLNKDLVFSSESLVNESPYLSEKQLSVATTKTRKLLCGADSFNHISEISVGSAFSVIVDQVGVEIMILKDIVKSCISIFPQAKYMSTSLSKAILENSVLLFSTVNTGGKAIIYEKEFPVCIIDEATQLVEAELANVLKPGLQHLILAGDHHQLPSTVISKKSKSLGYERSSFDRLISNNFPSFQIALINAKNGVLPTNH